MTTPEQTELLRSLPQINEIMQHPLIAAIASVPRENVVTTARGVISSARTGILNNQISHVDLDGLANQIRLEVMALEKPSLRPVINASGVIIHTNLGRSVLAKSAADAVDSVTRGYCTLEYNTDTLSRGSRHDHCEQLICTLTGAEAAIAVNNNAAAVMMVLAEFAAGHEAIVSRGELVEIGGSFRVPDIMAQSHATMVEVGATNKTHPTDYVRALTDDTAMLLKVHTSNYRMIGFTESVSLKELRRIADEERARRGEDGQELVVYEDQGSGSLIKLDCFGEYAEPTVAESLTAGVDLVSFSGDKLLGGPQAGIIVGKKRHIDRLKNHPLARALRLDKMTLAALEATLRLYLDEERALREIPTLNMLSAPAEEMKSNAELLKQTMESAINPAFAAISLEKEISRAGGGALPMCDIPTYCVKVEFKHGNALDADRYLVSAWETPVIGRLKKDCLLFDVRTLVETAAFAIISDALAGYFKTIEGNEANHG